MESKILLDPVAALLVYRSVRLGRVLADCKHTLEARWSRHVSNMYSIMLMRKATFWFTGYNSAVEGHEQAKMEDSVNNGGMPKDLVAVNDSTGSDGEGLLLSGRSAPGLTLAMGNRRRAAR